MGLLSNLLIPPQRPAQSKSSIVIDGRNIPITFRRNRQAKQFIMRVDKHGTGVAVTMPKSARQRDAMEFVADHAGWIKRHLAAERPMVGFAPGNHVPYLGRGHLIVHRPKARGTVWVEDETVPELHVAGRIEHLPRRLQDWLKKQARAELVAASDRYAAAMGTSYKKLTLRDQTTRWGSCTSAGSLSYSWRLILTEPDVLDYVAAHEVAHLLEMNHGPRFWALVRRHCPHADRSRRWLKTNGHLLHKYG
jgi:predicted metal-dependent hydrolase